jgi:hypothetical protein
MNPYPCHWLSIIRQTASDLAEQQQAWHQAALSSTLVGHELFGTAQQVNATRARTALL